MVFDYQVGSLIGKSTDALRTVSAKHIKKGDALLIVGGACEVNGSQAKYDLMVIDDKKTGLFLAGWIMAQQSEELQLKAIEEIKNMGVANVSSLQGQTGAVMRNLCGAAAGIMTTPWEGPCHALEGLAIDLTGHRFKALINIVEEDKMVMRECDLLVMSVTDGNVYAFYVHEHAIKLIEMEVNHFVTLVKTRPTIEVDHPIDLSSTPTLLALMKNLDKEPGSQYLRPGLVRASTLSYLVSNAPHFEPDASWRLLLPIGGGGEDKDQVGVVSWEVALACEAGLVRAKRLGKFMPAEVPSDKIIVNRLFKELVKLDGTKGVVEISLLGTPIVSPAKDRAQGGGAQGQDGGQGAGLQGNSGGLRQPTYAQVAAGTCGALGGGIGGGGNAQQGTQAGTGQAGNLVGGAGGVADVASPGQLDVGGQATGAHSTPDTHPEVWQLRGFVLNPEEWKDFIERGVVIFEKNEKRHATVLSSTYMAHGALQRYLNGVGSAVLGGLVFDKCQPGMRADQVLDLLFALDSHKSTVESNLRGAMALNPPIPGMADGGSWASNTGLRMVSDDGKLGETERRERTVLQADATSLQGDPEASAKLRALAVDLLGDDKEAAAGAVLVACTLDKRFARLLNYGTMVQQGLTGHCAQELETTIMGIRSILSRRHEKFVTAGTNNVCSDVMARALASIRQGRLRNLKLLELLDLIDKSTKLQPLAGLVDHADADILVHVAIAVLSTSWSYVQVADTAKIAIFCNTLSECIRKARNDGVPWVKSDTENYGLSQFMAAVWRKCDSNTESLMVAESTKPRSTPLIAWLNDGAFEWVRDLSAARGSAAAVAAAEKCTNRLLGEARKQSEAAGKARQTRSGGSSTAQEPPAKKSKSAKKKAAKAAGKSTANSQSPAAAPAAADPKVGDSRNKVQAELKTKYGVQDGKDPCYFHFINGKCNFTADNCRFHHVG